DSNCTAHPKIQKARSHCYRPSCRQGENDPEHEVLEWSWPREPYGQHHRDAHKHGAECERSELLCFATYHSMSSSVRVTSRTGGDAEGQARSETCRCLQCSIGAPIELVAMHDLPVI